MYKACIESGHSMRVGRVLRWQWSLCLQRLPNYGVNTVCVLPPPNTIVSGGPMQRAQNQSAPVPRLT